MSCELTGEKESKELLLASMHQMDNLTQLVNSGLKLTPKSGRTDHGKYCGGGGGTFWLSVSNDSVFDACLKILGVI